MKFLAFSSLISIVAGRLSTDRALPKTEVGSKQITPMYYPNYAQLSSSVTQQNADLGVGGAITYDSVDAQLGVEFGEKNTSPITFTSKSGYFTMGAPQMGAIDPADEFIADYWLKIDGANVPASGVRYHGEGLHHDVICLAAILELDERTTYEFMASGQNAQTEAITVTGEPLVPSIITSVFELPLPVFIQLSSDQTQQNGPLGKGVPLSFNSIDGASRLGLSPTDNTKIVVEEKGPYFILAAPQVGAHDPTLEGDVIADYWIVVNGKGAKNSNVRVHFGMDDEDVIVSQGVYELSKGDEVQVYGSGVNSDTKFISQQGQPTVPSIIFSMFELGPGAAYAQLSSTETQMNGDIGVGAPINFDSVDALFGLTWETPTPSEIIVQATGSYFILAAPQVAGNDETQLLTADYWIVVNGVAAANSNVQYQAPGEHEDVIVCQGVYELKAGDHVQVYGSGKNAITEVVVEPGEPLVPSIIFSMLQI